MKIAVLGMGRMGQAVAGRLLEADHELVVWDRTAGKAPDLVKMGASQAKSVAGAVDGAEVAITSLSNDEAVKEVARGDEGVLRSLGQGAVYVDASTTSPALSGQLQKEFELFVAMPILGSPGAVAAGQATYLVGGVPAAVDVVRPLLPALSERALTYSSAPLASTAKLTVNLLLLDGVVALAESFATGRSGGLSDEQLRELLGESPMLAAGLANRFEGVLSGQQEPWWSCLLGAKDAGLAVDLAAQAGHDLVTTKMVRDLYRKAASLSNDGDIASVANLYR